MSEQLFTELKLFAETLIFSTQSSSEFYWNLIKISVEAYTWSCESFCEAFQVYYYISQHLVFSGFWTLLHIFTPRRLLTYLNLFKTKTVLSHFSNATKKPSETVIYYSIRFKAISRNQ